MRYLIAANWKAHAAPAGACDANSAYRPHANVDVIVFPQFAECAQMIDAGLVTGAQHARPERSDTVPSIQLVREIGCTYLICGHSDRRIGLKETDVMVAEQVDAALQAGLIPILCIGETAEEFAAGNTKEVLKKQLGAIHLRGEIIVAYEPVWAIGTGKHATPEYAEDMHAFIRSLLPDHSMRILYGGSVTAENAKEFLSKPDINGLLIGGASLKPDEFKQIVDEVPKNRQ